MVCSQCARVCLATLQNENPSPGPKPRMAFILVHWFAFHPACVPSQHKADTNCDQSFTMFVRLCPALNMVACVTATRGCVHSLQCVCTSVLN